MSVEARALVSVEEYLNTSYDPDCDYVDGELVERNVGEFDHADLQGHIYAYLLRYRKAGYISVIEQRVQISPTRFRVPDVCVVRAESPIPQIFRTPPVAAIEVLSPEDRVGRIRQKIDDYLGFGIPNVWVVDPKEQRAFIYTHEGSLESADLILRADDCEIVLDLNQVFDSLQ
jgi:Uma2 family endonuclease